jgi:hypothetical protein
MKLKVLEIPNKVRLIALLLLRALAGTGALLF